MITALAVAISSVLELAWLPLRVSVALSALLTVTLLALALLTAWRSAPLVAMTLIAVAMIWRGEVWKMVFLQSERQVSELQRQLGQPSAPKKVSYCPESSRLCDARQFSLQSAAFRFLGATVQYEHLPFADFLGCSVLAVSKQNKRGTVSQALQIEIRQS